MPRLDAVTVSVERMERTLQFYRLLGFAIPATADAERYVIVDLGNGLRFEWTTEAVERSFSLDRHHEAVGGSMGITLRCAGATEVDATFQALVDAGHGSVLEPFDAPWGSRHCRVLDPDGNTVELYAPVP